MNNHKEQHSNNGNNGFSSGVLLGMILGGGLVYLLATKQGRKILKELSESGLEALDNLEEKVDPLEEVFDEELDDAGVPMAPTAVIEPEEKPSDEKPHKSTVRRFFKKAKKK